MKALLKRIVPSSLWKIIRTRKIVAQHKKVAELCESLVADYFENGEKLKIGPKIEIETDRIIWQYWAQGYDELPASVKECLESVEMYRCDCQLIRLDDSNVSEYVDIPDDIIRRCKSNGLAQYSDLLRLALLSAYGGVWIDATVKVTAPLPEYIFRGDHFVFRRDPFEKDRHYWENTYAYYFGWAKGFRVNMLSSIFYGSKDSALVSALCSIYMKYWSENDSLPDYFFLQILYDVAINGRLKETACPVISDCLPHLLQQYRNDPGFNLMTEDEIYRRISIHKLTYKSE